MNVKIVGTNIAVTEGIKTKIESKLSKLEKYDYLTADAACDVKIRTVKSDQIIEVRIKLESRKVIYAESRAESLYTAIDDVEQILARKIVREKEKILDKKREPFTTEVGEEMIHEEEATIKEKIVSLIPMTPEEAADQLELLGQDFRLFLNADTGNVGLIYKRKDANYGIVYAS